MSQNDFSLANAGGATFRADLNAALQAAASQSSGAAAPSPPYPNQWWMDTTANILKQRDNANTLWINVASKVGSVWIPYRSGVLLGDIATAAKSDIQNQTFTAFDDTGAANAYVITPSPAIAAYAKYQAWQVDIANANTGASTMNINALGVRNIFDYRTGAALTGGEIAAGLNTFIDDGTQLVLMTPRAGLLQTVNVQDGALATGTTTIPYDDSIPQNTEGDEYMTLAITPKSASSNLKIDVVVNLAHSSSAAYMLAALFRDSIANALAAAQVAKINLVNGLSEVVFTHYMASPGTSATTFKVRAGSSTAGTTTFNGQIGARRFGGVMASSITITEIL